MSGRWEIEERGQWNQNFEDVVESGIDWSIGNKSICFFFEVARKEVKMRVDMDRFLYVGIGS